MECYNRTEVYHLSVINNKRLNSYHNNYLYGLDAPTLVLFEIRHFLLLTVRFIQNNCLRNSKLISGNDRSH